MNYSFIIKIKLCWNIFFTLLSAWFNYKIIFHMTWCIHRAVSCPTHQSCWLQGKVKRRSGCTAETGCPRCRDFRWWKSSCQNSGQVQTWPSAPGCCRLSHMSCLLNRLWWSLAERPTPSSERYDGEPEFTRRDWPGFTWTTTLTGSIICLEYTAGKPFLFLLKCCHIYKEQSSLSHIGFVRILSLLRVFYICMLPGCPNLQFKNK